MALGPIGFCMADLMQSIRGQQDSGHSMLARGSAAPQEAPTSTVVDTQPTRMQGLVTLKKMLRVPSGDHELFRRYRPNPKCPGAFLSQAIEVTFNASRSGGTWELAGPLLGRVDPEDHDSPALQLRAGAAVTVLPKE